MLRAWLRSGALASQRWRGGNGSRHESGWRCRTEGAAGRGSPRGAPKNRRSAVRKTPHNGHSVSRPAQIASNGRQTPIRAPRSSGARGSHRFVALPRLGFVLARRKPPSTATGLRGCSSCSSWRLPSPAIDGTTTFTQHAVGGGSPRRRWALPRPQHRAPIPAAKGSPSPTASPPLAARGWSWSSWSTTRCWGRA